MVERVPGRAARFWLIFLLAHLAFAQPLFDLFGRQAEFLVAHAVTGGRLLVFVGLLGLAVPAAIAALGSLPGGRSGRFLFQALSFSLLALVVAPALNRAGLSGGFFVLAATIVALGIVLAHARFAPVRTFFSLFTLTVPVFIYLFLFHSRAEPLLAFDQAEPPGTAHTITRTPDIVFLVLDEFPLVSLLDSDLEIDAERYPNFAWLAQHANWYIDATTGAEVTVDAVPEALTGRQSQVNSGLLPIAAHHPNNLFSLLAGTYQVTARETATLLCPRSACANGSRDTETIARGGSLLRDSILVWAHLVTPLPLANRLPSVSDGWAGFGTPQPQQAATGLELEEALAKAGLSRQMGWESRGGRFQAFIEQIRPGDTPRLYYLHSLLPHRVWQYLPDGRQYLAEEVWAALDPPGPKPKQLDDSVFGHAWQNDPWAVHMARLRHLLQVQYTDALLGNLLQKLRDEDMFDDTLLVVVGDHGASFVPGEGRRAITRQSLSDISAVPLLIKLPGQKTGEVLQRQARLVDILPTISDVLGADTAWETDGHSLLDPDRPRLAEIQVKRANGTVLEYGWREHMAHLEQRAIDQEQAFGRNTQIPVMGPHAGLVGRSLTELDLGAAGSLRVQLDAPQLYRDVDPQGQFIPAHLSGRLEPPVTTRAPRALAIANDGHIVAVTQTYAIQGFEDRFEALLHPDELHQGDNALRFFLVYGSGGGVTLSELVASDGSEPRLLEDGQEWVIADFDGTTLRLGAERGGRVLTQAAEGGGLVSLHGTATVNDGASGTLLVFLDGRYAGRAEPRDGLYQLPLGISNLDLTRQMHLRAFEVDGQVATEVRYPPECAPDWAFAPPEEWGSIPCPTSATNPFVPKPDGYFAQLDFATASVRPYLRGGWDVEPGQLSWITGQRADLEVPKPGPLGDACFRLRVKPYLAPPRLPAQRMFVLVNDREVVRLRLESTEFIEASWPASAEVMNRYGNLLRLTFLTPDAASPESMTGGGDLRILGAAVVDMTVTTMYPQTEVARECPTFP